MTDRYRRQMGRKISLRKRIEKWLGSWIIRNEEMLLNLTFNLMLENEKRENLSQRVKHILGKLASRAMAGRVWGGVVVPLNYTIEAAARFLSSEEVMEIARHSKVKAIGECYCRKKYGDPLGLPLRTCIWLSEPTYLPDVIAGHRVPDIDLRPATLEEIEDTLTMSERAGLVHMAMFFPSKQNIYVICNCHPASCVALQAYLKHGVRALVRSNFVVSYDRDRCRGCQTCIHRCYFGALALDSQGKIAILEENCVGCGLCVSTCPAGALKLVRNGSHVQP